MIETDKEVETRLAWLYPLFKPHEEANAIVPSTDIVVMTDMATTFLFLPLPEGESAEGGS